MLIYNIGKLSCNIDTMYIAFIISLIAMHVQYTFVGKVSTCTCSMPTSIRSARGLYTSSTSYKFLSWNIFAWGFYVHPGVITFIQGLINSHRGYYIHPGVIIFTQAQGLLHSHTGYDPHTRVITFKHSYYIHIGVIKFTQG